MTATNKRKWFLLGAVATALLIIPRRSSRKADVKVSEGANVKTHNDSVKTNNVHFD